MEMTLMSSNSVLCNDVTGHCCDKMMSGEIVEDRGDLMTIVFMSMVRALLPSWNWVLLGKGRREGSESKWTYVVSSTSM